MSDDYYLLPSRQPNRWLLREGLHALRRNLTFTQPRPLIVLTDVPAQCEGRTLTVRRPNVTVGQH